jgi:hypothetical protein
VGGGGGEGGEGRYCSMIGSSSQGEAGQGWEKERECGSRERCLCAVK